MISGIFLISVSIKFQQMIFCCLTWSRFWITSKTDISGRHFSTALLELQFTSVGRAPPSWNLSSNRLVYWLKMCPVSCVDIFILNGFFSVCFFKGMSDTEEAVICKAIDTLTNLTELGLLSKLILYEMLHDAVVFLCHPVSTSASSRNLSFLP